jgi:hydrogenase maturation protein HypF
MALRFHDTVATMVVTTCAYLRSGGCPDRVVLSGGTWHNRYLLSVVVRELTRLGLKVYTHRRVPAGDGGLALGQAAIARWRLAQGQ